MTVQKKKCFDKVTLQKIGKSFLLSLLSGVSAMTAVLATNGSYSQAILVGISAMSSFIVNSIREYYNGIDDPDGCCSQCDR